LLYTFNGAAFVLFYQLLTLSPVPYLSGIAWVNTFTTKLFDYLINTIQPAEHSFPLLRQIVIDIVITANPLFL